MNGAGELVDYWTGDDQAAEDEHENAAQCADWEDEQDDGGEGHGPRCDCDLCDDPGGAR